MTDPSLPEFDSFRFVVDEIPSPVWAVDEELRFVFVNDYLLDRSDRSEDEWLGKPLVELWDRELIEIVNREELLDTLHAILAGSITESHTEVSIISETGSITRTVKSVPWTVDGTVKGVINIARDITDRKSRERQLKILDRVLRHNVRNEMSVVSGNAQILEQLGDGEVETYASNIKTTANRLLDTVKKERDIVDVIRKDLSRAEVDLVEVLERRLDGLRSEYSTVSVHSELPEQATVSSLDAIDRAIEELFENAIEHNDTGEPKLHVSVETVGEYVDLEIGDNGPGIPEEEVSVLTAAEIQPLYHGSGLGLWLVNWIVEESGGSLSFGEAELGGSSVTIRLPLAG